VHEFPWPEELFEQGRLTGILDLIVEVIPNEVKEGLEIGVSGMLGYLLTGTVEVG